MLPKLVDLPVKPFGFYPDAVPSESFLWKDAQNVEFSGGRILSGGARALALSAGVSPIRGFGAIRTQAGAQDLYFGTLTNLYRSVALSAPASVGSGFTTPQHETVSAPAGHWKFATWGEWMLASNGANPVQVRKASGNFVPLQQGGTDPLPFGWARLIARLGPHIVVANLPSGPNDIRWCSDDNIEDWAVLETNTAGDLHVRDADSEFIAMEPLGDRLALYTRESMYVLSYLGAPLVFGILPVLSGFGPWGPSSVVSIGREHFGWGPGGVWHTDGSQFSWIDDGSVKEFLTGQLFKAQASKIVGYHNEPRHRIEWYYPSTATGENDRGIAYDYLHKAWSRVDVGYSAVLERGVFQYPFGAVGSSINSENAGTPSGALLLSKPVDFGEVTAGKFISQVRIGYVGTLALEVGYSEQVNSSITWLPAKVFSGAWDMYDVNRVVRFLHFRIQGNGPWALAGISIYGRAAGRR